MNKLTLKNSIRLLEEFGEVKARSMFGGFGIFIENTMFALVVNDLLHIRADDTSLPDFNNAGFSPYIYEKKGFPVVTKYYALPTELWEEPQKILDIARTAFLNAKTEKQSQQTAKPQRIKDLPNLKLSTERMLKKAGITSVDELYDKGALHAFMAIKNTLPTSSPSLELLWALEGAIEGKHWSVISAERRDELMKKLEH